MSRKRDLSKLQLSRVRSLASELYERREQLLMSLAANPNNAEINRQIKDIQLEIRIADNEIEELTESLTLEQL